jgi:uncharacterized protein YjbK
LSEVEQTIMILSPDYEYLITIIKKVITTSGYLVEQKKIQHIEDNYFDTKDRILGKRKFELRLRIVDKKISMITLKLPKKRTESKFERLEIERPWSNESFTEIMNVLNDHLSAHKFGYSDQYYNKYPKIALANANFQKIQTRVTERKLINALNSQNKVDFEFAIDTVCYHPDKPSKRICLMELEIESKRLDNYDNLNKLVEKMIANKQTKFKLWSYSKLVTGKAIEILLSKKEIVENQDIDNEKFLTPSGIEKVYSFMKATSV